MTLPSQKKPLLDKIAHIKDESLRTFVIEGSALLEKDNEPNVITFAQFEPYIPLFRVDKKLYNTCSPDHPYRKMLDELFLKWKNVLGINLFQPTIVIQSEENPTELCVLDRMFTQIFAPSQDNQNHRSQVPGAVSVVSPVKREDLLLNATLKDIEIANLSPEAIDHFRSARKSSALITKWFVERNMSEDARAEIIGDQSDGEIHTDDISDIPGLSLDEE